MGFHNFNFTFFIVLILLLFLSFSFALCIDVPGENYEIINHYETYNQINNSDWFNVSTDSSVNINFSANETPHYVWVNFYTNSEPYYGEVENMALNISFQPNIFNFLTQEDYEIHPIIEKTENIGYILIKNSSKCSSGSCLAKIQTNYLFKTKQECDNIFIFPLFCKYYIPPNVCNLEKDKNLPRTLIYFTNPQTISMISTSNYENNFGNFSALNSFDKTVTIETKYKNNLFFWVPLCASISGGVIIVIFTFILNVFKDIFLRWKNEK